MDIDECLDGSHDCLPDEEVCSNIPGSYSCVCADGYKRVDGVCTFTCGSNTCMYGSCSNEHTCVCDEGWRDIECSTDIDECSEGTDTCNADEVCSNTEGSFICKNSLRQAIEEDVPEFITNLLHQEVYNIMAVESPNGFVPGTLSLSTLSIGNMTDTFEAEDTVVTLNGTFVPEDVLAWPVTAKIYSYLGLASTTEVDQDTGYFSTDIVVPQGLNPNFLVFTSATVYSSDVLPRFFWTSSSACLPGTTVKQEMTYALQGLAHFIVTPQLIGCWNVVSPLSTYCTNPSAASDILETMISIWM